MVGIIGTSAITLLLLAASVEAGDLPPIGRHYASPILIQAADPEVGFQMSQPEVIDISGDDLPDVVYSQLGNDGEAPAPLVIWTNNESGGLDLSTDALVMGGIPITPRGFRQILPADFNDDGRTDLYLESHGPEPDCGDGSVNCWPGGETICC